MYMYLRKAIFVHIFNHKVSDGEHKDISENENTSSNYIRFISWNKCIVLIWYTFMFMEIHFIYKLLICKKAMNLGFICLITLWNICIQQDTCIKFVFCVAYHKLW